MISTQAEARRLRSMDEATAIGRLADGVVMALTRRETSADLDDADRDALEQTHEWLGRSVVRVTDPLSLNSRRAHAGHGSSLDSFGPRLATAALDAWQSDDNADEARSVLEWLSAQIRAVLDGRASDEDVRQLHSVFEAVAESMLQASRSLRPSGRPTAWKTI